MGCIPPRLRAGSKSSESAIGTGAATSGENPGEEAPLTDGGGGVAGRNGSDRTSSDAPPLERVVSGATPGRLGSGCGVANKPTAAGDSAAPGPDLGEGVMPNGVGLVATCP